MPIFLKKNKSESVYSYKQVMLITKINMYNVYKIEVV